MELDIVRYRGTRFTPPTAIDGTSSFNSCPATLAGMSLALEHYCPVCGEDREFYKAASMSVHLGRKEKWHCPECDYGFVRIGGNVDSSTA